MDLDSISGEPGSDWFNPASGSPYSGVPVMSDIDITDPSVPAPEAKAVIYRMVTETHICPFGLKALDLLKRKETSMMLKRPRKPSLKASASAALMICGSILGMRRKTRIRKPIRLCSLSLPFLPYSPLRQAGQPWVTSSR